MKQRIITGVVAAALFIPFVIYGGAPFAVVISAIAIVGFYEILKMKGISIFSVPGLLGTLALLILVVPNDWSKEVVDLLQYESKYMIVYGLAALLLIYIVLVKNKMTFDEVGFILLSAFYVGLGFHYFIETRFIGVEFVVFVLLVVWTTDSGAYFVGRKLGRAKFIRMLYFLRFIWGKMIG